MKEYYAKHDYVAEKNTILDVININDYSNGLKAKDAWINVGGWQSWNPGFEIEPGKKQDPLKNILISAWNKWLVFPNSHFKPSKLIVLGQFITYLRWNDFYLVFASCGNVDNVLPPVQFVINRKTETVTIELCDVGKKYLKNELQSKIEIFTANSFKEAKDKITSLFGKLEEKNILGWESWYNHYEKINEELILKDLEEIGTTENLMKVASETNMYSEKIFQVDDGWQISLGDWDCNTKVFPSGLKSLTEKIENKGYVPGLWIAPFIIDLRSQFAKNHPEWLLRDKNGHLIKAGWNPRWGSNGTYYCLDLSNTDVQTHLSNLMDKAINEWGFRYLKLDFMYAGMFTGKFVRSGAAYEYFANAAQILTNIKQSKDGKPVYYLGCGIPLEMGFKNFPLSRIGCDTYEHWDNQMMKNDRWSGRTSAYLNMKDTIGKALWNGSVMYCDPDVIFIRKENCSLTAEEKKIIAFVDMAFGSQIMYSDDPSTCTTEEEINLTKEIVQMLEKYRYEKFSIKTVSKDLFEIESEKYRGMICLGDKHFLEITNKQ